MLPSYPAAEMANNLDIIHVYHSSGHKRGLFYLEKSLEEQVLLRRITISPRHLWQIENRLIKIDLVGKYVFSS